MAGKIKKNVLHFPKEDAMIVKLLMEHGSDVMAQTKEVFYEILLVFSNFVSTKFFIFILKPHKALC